MEEFNTRRCMLCKATLPLSKFKERKGAGVLDNFCMDCREKTNLQERIKARPY